VAKDLRRDLPLAAVLCLIAGTASCVFFQHPWPLVWAFGIIAVLCADCMAYNHFTRSTAPLGRGAEIILAVTSCAAVCVFQVLPFALIYATGPSLMVAAIVMLAAGAMRSTSMFGVSRIVGLATMMPYVVLPASALALNVTLKGETTLPLLINVTAIICFLAYVYVNWKARHASDKAVLEARAEAEHQRDLACRDATLSRHLFEQSSTRAALFDAEGRFVAVNASWCAAIGKDREAIIGQTMQQAMPDAKPTWFVARDATQHGISTQVKADPRLRPDGSTIYLDWEVHPWYRPDGTIGGSVGYASDVTEVLEAKARAEANFSKLQFALDAANAFIWEVDFEAQDVICDEAAVAFFGRKPEFQDFLGQGRDDQALVPPSDRPIVAAFIKDALAGDPIVPLEHRILDTTGVIRWVRSTVSTLPVAKGHKPKFLLMTTDISLQKAGEEELSNLMHRTARSLIERRNLLSELTGDIVAHSDQGNLDIPDLISGRAGETISQLFAAFDRILTEIDGRDTALAAAIQQLWDAQAAAEAANIAKSQFLANMSHELRTPLNAIIGYTEILLEDLIYEGRKEAAEDAQRVRRSATHLLSLINEILDLAKIETGKMDVNLEVTDLPRAVQDVVDIVQPQADANGNVLSVRFETTRRKMLSDPRRVRQCLLNLVANACKFTKNGTVDIVVSEFRTADALIQVQIKVIDTGIGISSEALEHVFKPFSQADASTTRDYGGTGLGLAITRETAELLGGRVDVESVLGKGSSFVLTIPTQGLEACDAEFETAGLEATVPLVLIVDDDPVARALAMHAAKSIGFGSIGAPTAHAALALLSSGASGSGASGSTFAPNLILQEFELPDMSGADFVERVQELELPHQPPILFVSINDDRRAALNAGASEHLAKPCPSASLAAAMLRLAHVPGSTGAAKDPQFGFSSTTGATPPRRQQRQRSAS
jgi:PAS domain S-box-containing protein